MRICHVWHNFYPTEFGGVERYILSLSNYLSEKDKNIQFLLLTDKAAYVPLTRALKIPSFQKINSLEVYRLDPNLSSLIGGASRRFFHRSTNALDHNLTVNLFKQAAQIKGMDKVDVFHVHGIWKPLYPTIGLLLSQYFHRPLVVTLHGDSVDPKNPFAMHLKEPAILNVLKKAGVITTFSNEAFNVLNELGLKEKSRIVPNFVDPNFFKRPESNIIGSGKRVLMITRLNKSKDPMTSIRAFAKVVKQVPDATFDIVGYGPLYQDSNRLVHELKLGKHVTLIGMKSDVREFLWNSDIIIGTKGSYMTTLEAWSAGLAVVAPRTGIMNQIIADKENGLLVPPGNADQLAEVLIKIIKNKTQRTSLVRNGLKTIENHDIRKVAPIIFDLYMKELRGIN